MPLFNFDLTKLEEITPWGTPPDEYLSWFGLTDGVYYLDVNGRQLFRYSEETVKHWREKHPNLRDEVPSIWFASPFLISVTLDLCLNCIDDKFVTTQLNGFPPNVLSVWYFGKFPAICFLR